MTRANQKKTRVSKLNLWFKHFTDEACSTTFLHRTESARAAGYKTEKEESLQQIGWQNFKKLTEKIEKWLDEAGLSENALRLKLLSLMEADETKLITIKGDIEKDDLPPGCQIITTSKQKKLNASGKEYTEINNIIAIDMAAKETQRRTLDMALKVRGMYAPEKHEHTGKDGGPIRTKQESDLTPEELIKEMQKRGLPIPKID